MPPLSELLGIELPIIQAPMAGAQGPAMAMAVAQAGGLGSLPCAMLSVEGMREELAIIRAQTGKPINLNFFCHREPVPNELREANWRKKLAPYYKELGLETGSSIVTSQRRAFNAETAEALADLRPAVVSFHFGLPSAELLGCVRDCGAKILSSATTVEEARWLEAHDADMIVAQGWEAGGHRGNFLGEDLGGQAGTFALVSEIIEAVRLPVIAAGGIADAEGVAAAMKLGAAAVQIGTAYLLCPESTISSPHRAALKSEAARHTTVTNVLTGRPARGIVNRLIRELGRIDVDAPEFPLAYNAVAPLRAKAESMGRGDFSPMWAGQNAAGCKEISAGELTRELAALL